jgi:hypothetical protein
MGVNDTVEQVTPGGVDTCSPHNVEKIVSCKFQRNLKWCLRLSGDAYSVKNLMSLFLYANL